MSYCIQRAPLRRYFPCADGRANPLQWFVLDSAYETSDGAALCIGGPFTRKREAEAFAEQDSRELMAELQRGEP